MVEPYEGPPNSRICTGCLLVWGALWERRRDDLEVSARVPAWAAKRTMPMGHLDERGHG